MTDCSGLGLFNVCPQASVRHLRPSREGQTSNKPKPKAPRRKRGANAQAGLSAVLLIAAGRSRVHVGVEDFQFQGFTADGT